jgi:hypothetical protein
MVDLFFQIKVNGYLPISENKIKIRKAVDSEPVQKNNYGSSIPLVKGVVLMNEKNSQKEEIPGTGCKMERINCLASSEIGNFDGKVYWFVLIL